MKCTYTLSQTPAVASKILGPCVRAQTFALVGELGAGKTTLVAAMCRELGVEEPTSSPTFSLVNEYRGKETTVYHLDCYRLSSLEEALAAGLEEIFADENVWVFVEWPAVIEPLLPDTVTVLRLDHSEDGRHRQLTVSKHE